MYNLSGKIVSVNKKTANNIWQKQKTDILVVLY